MEDRSMPTVQNFRNHARIVPAYHVGVFVPFLANFIWAFYRLIRMFNGETFIAFLVSIALLLMFFSLRVQVLTVQDRVIRLEMRLRLLQALPPDLQAHIPSLSHKQLVALRFASDGELPGLVREVLAGTLKTQKDIKARVREWQADYLRA
jgi:Family of unknown function (DUF6526)